MKQIGPWIALAAGVTRVLLARWAWLPRGLHDDGLADTRIRPVVIFNDFPWGWLGEFVDPPQGWF